MSDDTKKGSALPWIVVLLAVAGAAAWWFMTSEPAAPAEAPEPAAAEAPVEPEAPEPEATPEPAPAPEAEAAPEPAPAPAPEAAPEPEPAPEAAAVAPAPAPEPEGEAEPIDRERIYFPTPSGIRDALRAHKREVDGCFEGWMASQPELEKGAVVSFIIHSSARGDGLAAISKVAFKSVDLEHIFMEGCIGRVVGALRFAVPDGDVFVDEPVL